LVFQAFEVRLPCNYQELPDAIVDEPPSVRLELEERRQAVEKALSQLTERERTVLELHYLNEPPLTLFDIGTRMGIQTTRVHQIKAKAIMKFRQFYKENES
jgi:RNA polymerase sigma factor (sigma-70 family)